MHCLLIDFAVASLLRRKTRNGGLLAVYTLIVFVLGSIMLFGEAIRREAAAVLKGAPEVTAQAMRMGRHDFATQADIPSFGRLLGVTHIEGRLWGYHFDTASAANYTLQVPLAEDSAHALARGETIVGEGVARVRKLVTGGYLFLVSAEGKLLKLKVKEMLPAASALVSSDLVLVSEADFREFFGPGPGSTRTSRCRSRTRRRFRNVAAKVARRLPDARTVPCARTSCAPTSRSSTGARASSSCCCRGAAARVRHLRPGEGLGAVGRREARDRHSQGDRLGNRRRDCHEGLGGRARLADGVPGRLRGRLPARVPVVVAAVRTRAERLVRALSAL